MAAEEKALVVRRITQAEAARAFVACAGLDPEGRATPESAAAAGHCFVAEGAPGAVAFAVVFDGGVAWIVAAAGGGAGMAAATLGAIETLARAQGCRAVEFQTMRPGLQRVALRQGYKVTEKRGQGVKLEKNL